MQLLFLFYCDSKYSDILQGPSHVCCYLFFLCFSFNLYDIKKYGCLSFHYGYSLGIKAIGQEAQKEWALNVLRFNEKHTGVHEWTFI